ncbi:MAG: pseudomurein-binding protein [Methanobacterium sp.]|nr:pseudomurein-binding protein [Methanobacterium sp.]
MKIFCSNYSPKFNLGHGGGKIKRTLLAFSLLLISCIALSSCSFATETNQTTINGYTYTSAQIQDATDRVNAFQETNNRLPNYVTISGQKILINDFLPYMGNTGSTSTTNSSSTGTSAGTSTTTGVSFTSAQINDASNRVNSFIGTNSRLPNYVTIGSYQVTIPQFLQLMAQNIVNLNSGITSSITLKTVNSPSSASETVTSGSISKTEYVTIAKNILSTITSTGQAPSNVNSSLGTLKYETVFYSLSKILNYYKTNSRLPNYVSVSAWSTGSSSGTTTNSSSVQAILDSIGYAEAKFLDIQGQSSASVMTRVGYGDCWADSEWLYNKLNTAGIAARIMGYVGGGTGAWYRHAWVQINTGNGWVNWSYTKYSSHHFGDGLGAAAYVLIAASSKIVDVSDMVATGY